MKIYNISLPIVAGLSFLLLYLYTSNQGTITFSDSAKFGDIARSLATGEGYKSSFIFYNTQLISSGLPTFANWIPPLMPITISFIMRLVGINDIAIIITSSLFYLLTVIFTFKLGERLFNHLTGVIGSLAVASNINFLDYAANGASEPLFSFEIILSAYLFTFKRKQTDILALIVLGLMYLTRPQAFIYITGLMLYRLLLSYSLKKTIIYFSGILLAWFLIDITIISRLSETTWLYSIVGRGTQVTSSVGISESASNMLRSGNELNASTGVTALSKKVFYNLYNFYRLMPQILSPYLFAFFTLGLIIFAKKKNIFIFIISTLLMFVVTLIVTAVSIPFFRYIHPMVPLIYLLGVATLIKIISHSSKDISILPSRAIQTYSSFILIIIFCVGQTLGVIFLDSRSPSGQVNESKSPVYVTEAKQLKNVTDKDMTIITNLDTWGSWYGERKTIWFPLEPYMLEPVIDKVDAIYLTNYKMDDENYYMGNEWRQMFNNPQTHNNEFIEEHFEFVGEYIIPAEDTYENQEGRAVLWKNRK